MDNIVFSLNNFEYFLLILVRIASFIFIAPIFGQNGIPRQIKIGLSFFISIFMYNIVEYPTLNYGGIIGYSILVLKEGITGLLIGFAANICSSIVLFAGNIIDMDIGLSMATEFNPEINNQVTVTGNLYYYALMLMLLATNMHIYVLRAVCDSFQLIPIGEAEIQWDHLMITFSGFMTDLMVIGFRIFLPCKIKIAAISSTNSLRCSLRIPVSIMERSAATVVRRSSHNTTSRPVRFSSISLNSFVFSQRSPSVLFMFFG